MSRTAASILLAACLAGCGASTPLSVPLTAQANIQLPPDVTKPTFDLLTLDPARGYLYVAHTSASSLHLIDTKQGKLVGSVTGLPGIKAVALSPDPNIVFVSNSSDGTVAVVDVGTMKVLERIPVNGSADAIDYDPVHNLVAVTLGGAKEVGVIDVATRKVVGTIKLPGAPELITIDKTSGRLFVAINDKNEVAVIDLGTREITSIYKGCDLNGPTGMAYDSDHGRLFIAGRGTVSVIDALIDKCLGAIDIGSGVDQITINLHKHHLYTANGGSRNLSVIDTGSLRPLGEVGTGPSGDGVAADPTTDRVYVIVGRAGIIAVYHDP